MNKIIDKMLKSDNPIIKYKICVNILNESPNSPKNEALKSEIRNHPIVQALLFNSNEKGQIISSGGFYHKWTGANWVLATLADIGYPKNDTKIEPLINQVVNYWLLPIIIDETIVDAEDINQIKSIKGVPIVNGRARRCASQQAFAVFSSLTLGDENEKIKKLVDLLLKWQWPDGGWNCDRNPSANTSSFYETIVPLRALGLYERLNVNNPEVEASVKRASEVFLQRHLFKSIKTGKTINENFLKLHYPYYWRYNILLGLKVMAENDLIKDSRCADALDIIENKYIENHGWPAEIKYYKTYDYKSNERAPSNADLVDWGGVNKKNMNEWVTLDALYVLSKAGRIDL
jgi:hypothetical protein